MTRDRQAARDEVSDLSLLTHKAYAYFLPSGVYFITASQPSQIDHPLVAVAIKGRIMRHHAGSPCASVKLRRELTP